jgi:hypothetical protein
MRIYEVADLPRLVKLHYFNVDDEQAARQLGFKQDKNFKWYLPQYNTSGVGFNQKYSSAVRTFNRPIRVIDLIK